MRKLIITAVAAIAVAAASPALACTLQDASQKAQQLSIKLTEMLEKDIEKAQAWSKRAAVISEKYKDGAEKASLEEICKLYDALLEEFRKL
ncbi:MAG: hypothetical protein AB7G15_11230 [Alphaproteobacteria bacterium]